MENYEYGFFWYLYQDGNIQCESKRTGILSLGALPTGEKSRYGVLVAPQVYAPNHQHFFNVRRNWKLLRSFGLELNHWSSLLANGGLSFMHG